MAGKRKSYDVNLGIVQSLMAHKRTVSQATKVAFVTLAEGFSPMAAGSAPQSPDYACAARSAALAGRAPPAHRLMCRRGFAPPPSARRRHPTPPDSACAYPDTAHRG